MPDADQAPGPALAGALAAADPESLEGDELAAVIAGCERMISWAHARQLAAITVLGARMRALVERLPEGPGFAVEPMALTTAEVAVALTISEFSAGNRVELAGRLVDLPATAAALGVGAIDIGRVRAITEATEVLSRDAARTVEDRVLVRAPGQTAAQLRRSLGRAVSAADPAAADKRHTEAVRTRRVTKHVLPDGIGGLWIEGPADGTVALHTALTILAARARERDRVAARGAGRAVDDEPGMDARRFDALVAWAKAVIAHQDDALRPAREPRPATTSAAGTAPGRVHPHHSAPPGGCDPRADRATPDEQAAPNEHAAPEEHAAPGHPHAGGDPEARADGTANDHHDADDHDADDHDADDHDADDRDDRDDLGADDRDDPGDQDARADLAEPDGRGTGRDPANPGDPDDPGPHDPGEMALPEDDDGDPWDDEDESRDYDLGLYRGADHWIGAPTVIDPDTGEIYTSADVLVDPLTGAVHPRNRTARSPAGRPGRGTTQLHVTVAAETVLGMSEAPGELTGYGPIPAAMARRLAAGSIMHRLLTDPLSGTLLDYGTTTYQVPVDLAAHVMARDGTCRGPGCGRSAADCDLDHTVPYPQGHTCADNLGGGCRHHHLFKTAGLWSVEQLPDGVFVFRTATGLQRIVHPADLREAMRLMPPAEDKTNEGEQGPDPGEQGPDVGEHGPDAGEQGPDAGERGPDAA